jgi:phospholipid/cholesterol/gamma-HCH transport system permease protein
MITSFIEAVGNLTLAHARPVTEMAAIFGRTLQSVARLSFLNFAVLRVLVYELYVTTVNTLPIVILSALVLGSLTVFYLLRILTSLGAYDRIGEYLIQVMLHELAPIATTIILMLRSGTATISQLAIMKVHGELRTLEFLHIRFGDYVCLPRLAAFAFAGPSSSVVFSLVGLVGSFLILGFTQDITFGNFIDQLVYDIQPRNMVIGLTKPLAMSLGVGLISIQRGLSAQKTIAEIPSKLVQGMMFTIIMIMAVEVVFIIIS